jgi:mannose-6-phosphate isomerase-like protein (cupin superfamily)
LNQAQKIRRALAIVVALAIAGGCAKRAMPPPAAQPAAREPAFLAYADLKWDPIIPELGVKSPEITILHVDPTTHATHLLIRTPAAIHIRKHWHTANETHTIIYGSAVFACDGKRAELGPGSFNFMPAKMVHEAWLPAGTLTLITVDREWDVTWVEGPPTAADLNVPAPRAR